jgi:hypothetical protein
MMKIGAIWTPFGVQLRLPKKGTATDVYGLLMNEMPEARWSIVETSVGRVPKCRTSGPGFLVVFRRARVVDLSVRLT